MLLKSRRLEKNHMIKVIPTAQTIVDSVPPRIVWMAVAPATLCRPAIGERLVSLPFAFAPPPRKSSPMMNQLLSARPIKLSRRAQMSQREEAHIREGRRLREDNVRDIPADAPTTAQHLCSIRDLFRSVGSACCSDLSQGSEETHVSDLRVRQTKAPEDERGVVGRETDQNGREGRSSISEYSACWWRSASCVTVCLFAVAVEQRERVRTGRSTERRESQARHCRTGTRVSDAPKGLASTRRLTIQSAGAPPLPTLFPFRQRLAIRFARDGSLFRWHYAHESCRQDAVHRSA